MKTIVKILLCVTAFAAVALTFAGCGGETRELTREELLAESYAEAERMNSESWFGEYNGEECEFLMNLTTGYGYLPFFLENGTMVSCTPFGDGSNHTTLIALGSPDVDLYGIRLGDSLEQTEKLLKDLDYDYAFDLYSHSDYSYAGRSYVKGYVYIDLRCESPDNPDEITTISVSAHNGDRMSKD